MKTTAAVLPGAGASGDIERLRGKRAETMEGEKARLRKATKEFESFFTYYLLKTMRETVPKNTLTEGAPMQDGMGKEIFTDLFDMEVSRSMAGGSQRSIGDMMYRSLEKVVEAQYQTKIDLPKQMAVSRSRSTGSMALKRKALPIQSETAAKAEMQAIPQTTEPLFRTITPAVKAPSAAPLEQSTPVTAPASETESTLMPTHTPETSRKSNGKSGSAIERIVDRFGDHIDQAARSNKVDSSLIVSVIRAESSGNPSAVSPKGAKGLMQLADSTAEDYGVSDSFDPAENIHAGSKLLRRLLDKYQDVTLALAAYNAGPGNVDKYGGVPPFKETQDFVARVTGFLSEAAEVLTGQDLKNPKN
jgi:soluble lytic murein transglycosylase-like protein